MPASSGWPRRPSWWSASLVRRHELGGIDRFVLGRGDVPAQPAIGDAVGSRPATRPVAATVDSGDGQVAEGAGAIRASITCPASNAPGPQTTIDQRSQKVVGPMEGGCTLRRA